MIRSHLVMLVAAGLVSGAPAKALAERTKLAVLDLEDKGVEGQLAKNLSDVVTAALGRLGVFDVLSRADIQRAMVFETQKQMLGCESQTSCLAEIGGALGVALLVTGSVGKVGANYIINLALTDSSTVTVVAREQREVTRAEELTAAVEGASRFLVRSLLAGQQGDLVLMASESAADVEIDGHIVGVTPWPRQALAGGPHTLRLSKAGFVTWAKDIEIKKGEPLVVEAKMVPSLEFIGAYDQRARTWRILALSAGGLGLAGVGFGVGGWLWNGGRASTYDKDLAAANCQAGASGLPMGDCAALKSRHDGIKRFDTIVQVVGFVGLAALAAGTYLFVQGPTPGIYDQYKAAGSVTVGFVPTRHGAAVAGVATF